ncbi:hypothetical protein T492DRAFT_584904 [Pavlovales sp. CCMP2436]|nr:hypothetical protein T492DRAFT_584904 [Pavlovales sp. CCMP2436]
MHVSCALACGACDSLDFGAARAAATQQASAQLSKKKCADKAVECPLWARDGECERNPRYMKIHCASSCDTCDWADFDKRCRVDPSLTLALPDGAIGELFRALDGGAFAQYKPRIMSRPPEPWVVVFDSFISEEDADRIVELANLQNGSKFTPSQGTSGLDAQGQLIPSISDYRTSSTRWCEADCLNESSVVHLRERVVQVTGVPDANHEYPQLLRYESSQYYKEHSDYIPAHKHMPCGPRVLTLFVYLIDVEKGGYTSFPKLGLSVQPKKGRAVLWPSVLDAAPMDIDERTVHVANPVIKGCKYSVNIWLHQMNFKDNHHIGCTG